MQETEEGNKLVMKPTGFMTNAKCIAEEQLRAPPPQCGDYEVNPQLSPLLVSQTSDAVRPKSCYLLVSSMARLSVGVCLLYLI